ncbi:phage tail family protein [Elizabethkingia anophelis]|uniref:hypothetical protein n=1 Tax=Elizabethkingia anophelis TaxID=1117645 RepID=UPI000466E96A|nr:hypothetical protein [Elizabethkingia anophelis]
MGKINWSINGKNFESFGIKVSSSRGLGDDLKQKERQSYNWPGRNGRQYNLNSKPKYEERIIELDCFIVGNDWDLMVNQFNLFTSEFSKIGTQRFIVEVFSFRQRVYDIILSDKTVLNEVKQEGQNFGTFTLKFVEPEPIKKILYTESTNLQLSFNTPSSVIINIDGKAQQAKGDVSINTNLPKRVISGGIKNLLLESNVQFSVPPGNYRIGGYFTSKELEIGKTYTLMYKSGNGSYGEVGAWVNARQMIGVNEIDSGIKTLTFVAEDIAAPRNVIDFFSLPDTNKWGSIHWAVLVEGSAMPFKSWVPAPEDQHYISIAGNIDEITNLNTNAQILWEKL